MAGIKISDLPPNTLPLVGDEQMELENADGDSTRATVADIASSASGLDATFVTITANAALPNERVLTAGTNISIVDNGAGSTVVISASGVSFPLLAPDGSAAAPSYSFTNDPGAGMFLNALGELSLAADGVEILRAINGAQNQVAIAQSGSTSVPDLTSLADLDTGFRWDGSNETIWIGGGSRSWNFSTVKFYSQFSNGPGLFNRVAERDVPTLVPDHSDSNSGVGGQSDEVTLIAGGIEGVRVDETGSAIQVIIDPGTTNTSDAAPQLAFGGGTVGFRSPDSDQIFVSLSGTSQWHFTTQDFHANVTDGPALRFVNPSDTVPSLLPNQNDIDTGIGTAGPDILNLITGGLEAVEYAEVGDQVLQINLPETGIVASTTQTQGERPLISSYNEVASVANPNDVVTAPAVRPGMRLIIINNGANTLQVFPASGDNIGAGVDGSITVAVGENATFLGIDFTEWEPLYNGPSTPSVTIPDPLLLTSGSAGAPSYSFSVDSDTGVFNPGADLLGLTAGGVEIARADGVANQFLATNGAGASAPGYSFISDPDTGMRREDTDRLALTAGGVDAVMYQEGFGTGVLAASQNDIGLTASVTQTQAGGLVLRSSYNEVATVATTGDALTLQGPPTLASVTGKHTVVVNNGVNDLQLFPALGDDLGAGVNASITVVAGGICVLLGRDGTNWDVLYNDVPSPGGTTFPLLAPDGTAGAPSYSFSSETNAGMYYDGQVKWSALGSEVMRMDDTGLLGPSASAPTWYLISDEAATATNPIYSFNNDQDTGIGLAAADQLSLIAGGMEGIRISEGAGIVAILPGGPTRAPDGTAAAPTYSFVNDIDSGFYSVADNVIGVSLAGSATWLFGSTTFASSGGLGADLRTTVSAVAPSLIPRGDDDNTGIGWNAVDQLSLIAGGVEGIRITEDTSNISVDIFGDATISHTSTEDDDVSLQINHDAAGFADSHALGIDHITGALASGEEEAVVLINVDANLATGGTISGLEVLAAEPANADLVTALLVGGGVAPVTQLSGSFADADTVLDNAADVTVALSGGGAGNIGIFDADNDTVTVGFASTFQQIEFILDTVASSAGIQPLFEFSTGVGTWATFSPTDGTNQMRQSGVIAWLLADIPSWATGTGGEFLIRITRQRNTLGTTPIADLVQVLVALLYQWDENADLNINSIAIQDSTQADSITIDNDGTDVNITTVGITDINVTGTGAERFRLVEPNVAMQEKAAAPGDEAGFGQFWVRDDTPNTPMFTDDAGTDFVLNSSGLDNDACQARRTTNYDLTTAFVDITMDTTDIETDSAVIDHDLATNSDNIIFGVSGTYEVTYDFDVICEAVSGDPIIDMGCRVRLNDAGTGIAGSHANPYVFRDGSVGGDDGNVQKHISNTFIVTVSATDFITLQLDKTELSGSETFAVSKICVKARRLL